MTHKGKRYRVVDGQLTEIKNEKPLVYDLNPETLPFRVESDANAELAYYIWRLSVNFVVQSNRYANLGVRLSQLIAEYLGKDKLESMSERSLRGGRG